MKEIKITDVRVQPGDSAFLIDDGKTSVLYDSGFAFTGYGVAKKIKEYLGNRKLDYIFLTHSHYDHAAGSPYVLEYFPDAKIVAGEYASKIFAKPTAKSVMRDLDKKIAAQNGVYEYEDLIDNLKVDITVCDGDVIKAGDMEFICFNLPGHTRCSVGYYCPMKKLFLSCETIGVYNGADNVVPSYLVDYEMTVESITRVKNLEIENMLIPHFGLLKGEKVEFFLDKSIKSTIETTKEIKEMIRENKSDEKIVEFFKNKFYNGYIKEIYPIDAMELNTNIMINLIRKNIED